MATHMHIKGNIKSEFLLMIVRVHSSVDLLRALGKRPLLKRKPKLDSKLCSQSQSYNELHV